MITTWSEQIPSEWLQEMVNRQSCSQAEPQELEAAIILKDLYLKIHNTVVRNDLQSH